jgi:hypothetical protein
MARKENKRFRPSTRNKEAKFEGRVKAIEQWDQDEIEEAGGEDACKLRELELSFVA